MCTYQHAVLQTVAPQICRIRDNVLSWHKAAGQARFVGVRASELQTCGTLNLALHFEFQEGAGARSLVSQRINGIEQRGFAGRIIAEENPDRGAKEEIGRAASRERGWIWSGGRVLR